MSNIIGPDEADDHDRRAFKVLSAWLEPLGALEEMFVDQRSYSNEEEVVLTLRIVRNTALDVLGAVESELQARGRRAMWLEQTGSNMDGYVRAHEPAMTKKELDEMLDLFDPDTRAKIELDAEVQEGVRQPRRRATKIPKPKEK